jgi:hypothetical protein
LRRNPFYRSVILFSNSLQLLIANMFIKAVGHATNSNEAKAAKPTLSQPFLAVHLLRAATVG